jgi:hypothetical protein
LRWYRSSCFSIHCTLAYTVRTLSQSIHTSLLAEWRSGDSVGVYHPRSIPPSSHRWDPVPFTVHTFPSSTATSGFHGLQLLKPHPFPFLASPAKNSIYTYVPYMKYIYTHTRARYTCIYTYNVCVCVCVYYI